MAKQNSFDIVSQVDMAEVKNAVNQATKELIQRFDLKGSNSSIELNDKDGKLVLASADEFRLNAVNTILQQKLVRRGVSLKALTYGTVEPAAHGTVRQTVTLQPGRSSRSSRSPSSRFRLPSTTTWCASRARTATPCRMSSPSSRSRSSRSICSSPTTGSSRPDQPRPGKLL